MTTLPKDAPLVALKRGDLLESVHRGRLAVCDPSGEVVEAAGDAEGFFYPRSALKPFQALPLVLSGAAEAFGLCEEEVSVACASHAGEERHVAAVTSILKKIGLSEADLDNGAHPPLHAPSAEDLVRRGEGFGKVHGNCSGKHAGMLAVCVHEGWSTKGYRNPDHPLQRRVLEVLAVVCGVEPERTPVGGDGCGAPAFAMPVRSLATGFARLATGEGLPEEVAEAAIRVRDAMRGHPFMVSGTGRFDTDVMEKTDLVAKGGADGVWACGSEEGWGIALKISDGASRAVPPAASFVLGRRGVGEVGGSFPVRDLHGEEVGEMAPILYDTAP